MIEGWAGQEVRKCRVLEFEFRPGDARSISFLELTLDGEPISIGTAGSGDLRFEAGPVPAVDMEEAGRTMVRDDGWPCDVLNGARLARVEPLIDGDGNRFGAELATEAGELAFVVNWGDELLLESELPAYVVDELRK